MNAVRTLRLAGILEGISYLLLLFVAMPLKYVFLYPLAVRITGALHGLLFLWFLAALFRAHTEREWPVKASLGFLLAAVTPFGFVLVDRSLRRELEAVRVLEVAQSDQA